MNTGTKSLVFLACVAVVAIAASLVTEAWLRRPRPPADTHAWIHRQLGITPEQEAAIESIEHRFAERRRDLTTRIQLANTELAQAILKTKAPSPQVADAIKKIHEAQAELQQATIDHVFEMRGALRPDQYDKLLDLTANALSGSPQ